MALKRHYGSGLSHESSRINTKEDRRDCEVRDKKAVRSFASIPLAGATVPLFVSLRVPSWLGIFPWHSSATMDPG
jgi:hypothetical protein